MNAIEIGQRLRKVRKENHLTIREVAEQLDLGEGYWDSVELGKKLPSLETLALFLNLFHTSADYILYGTVSSPCPEQIDHNCLVASLADLSQQDLSILADILGIYVQKNLSAKSAFDQPSFAKRLRAYRENSSLTIQQLSEKTGLIRTHIQQIELYGVIPTLKTLDKVAAAMDMSIDWVLADTISAGRPILLEEIISSFQQLTAEQQKIAANMMQAYVKAKKNT